jgi:hypothetical protein
MPGWRMVDRPTLPFQHLGRSDILREDKHPVSAVTKELYASPNGDRWYLARCGDSGRVFVRHVANPASGGKETTIELGEFLSRPGNPPEKQALVRLVGSLIQAPHGSGAPANSN